MRHELSTLELRILARELNAVKGYYIDQFYQLGSARFRMKLSSKEGKINLNIDIPDYIALSNVGELSEEATGFAMAVRKRIAGARISDISLLNNDRILKIGVERKEFKGSLILEMFGRGNLIITDENMETQLALQTHEFADREIRKGEKYNPPKGEGADITDDSAVAKVFESVKEATGTDRLISYLSRRLGVGSMYLEDAIRRQGKDPKVKIKDVDQKTLEAIRERISAIAKSDGKAILYLKDGKPEDVALADIEKYAGLEKKEMPLNDAIKELYSSPQAEVAEKSEEVERLEANIRKQEEAIIRMRQEEKECREKGDFISANIAAVSELIKTAATKKVSEEELNALAKGFKVKRIDRAKKVIIVEKGDDAK